MREEVFIDTYMHNLCSRSYYSSKLNARKLFQLSHPIQIYILYQSSPAMSGNTTHLTLNTVQEGLKQAGSKINERRACIR